MLPSHTRLVGLIVPIALVLLALLLPELRELAMGSLLAAVLIGGNLYSFRQSQKRFTETMRLVEEARHKVARFL
jgi:hypothetical protein